MKGRGRPPKSVQIKSHTSSSSPILPPPPTEESSTSAFSESAVTNPKLTSPNTNERADVKIENEIEDYNISSTSSGKCHLLSKVH